MVSERLRERFAGRDGEREKQQTKNIGIEEKESQRERVSKREWSPNEQWSNLPKKSIINKAFKQDSIFIIFKQQNWLSQSFLTQLPLHKVQIFLVFFVLHWKCQKCKTNWCPSFFFFCLYSFGTCRNPSQTKTMATREM